MRFLLSVCLVLVLLIVDHAYGQSVIKPTEGKERFNFFDLELLKSLASSEKGNLLVSPVSVKAALAMILEGAGGKSAKELREALRLTDDVKDTRIQFRNFLNSLQVNTPGTKVEAANQVFLSQNITPQTQYETMLKNHYFSNIEKVDFSKPIVAAEVINRWVNMLTHGLIPVLVEPGKLSSSTKLMIANAIYFKGKWKNAFDFDKTTVKCFYIDVNVCLDTYSMESVNVYNFAYIPSLKAHAVELPYEGDKFSLMLLLPTTPLGIAQLVRDLTHISLHNIVSALQPTELLISLPRFKIDYNTDLLHKLNELGIQEIFTPNANLSGIVQWANDDLHISNVLHKGVIDVNEEGTEAAAATGTIVVPLMGTALPKLNFNHPFLFFLRNTESGDILFAGRLSQPDEVKSTEVGNRNGVASSGQSGILAQKPPATVTSSTTSVYTTNLMTTKPPSHKSNILIYPSRNMNMYDGAIARSKLSPESQQNVGNTPKSPNAVNLGDGHMEIYLNAPAPTQILNNNSKANKMKFPTPNETQVLASENTNQNYSDRIHFT
ncbi:hypothetical protein L9F63_004177 [Diploptera punctata]|uniref:Serpin domain-containing protein n=1 Tax=Diploptera punctata TaxID=6984 RepID=A0AAD7ZGE5_DIPPU|nr:hypothetical protein L9F63_004177 [Diploptera punctata]